MALVMPHAANSKRKAFDYVLAPLNIKWLDDGIDFHPDTGGPSAPILKAVYERYKSDNVFSDLKNVRRRDV
jgi:hypothetical protein